MDKNKKNFVFVCHYLTRNPACENTQKVWCDDVPKRFNCFFIYVRLRLGEKSDVS